MYVSLKASLKAICQLMFSEYSGQPTFITNTIARSPFPDTPPRPLIHHPSATNPMPHPYVQVWECTDAPQYHHHKPNYNPCCLQKPNRLRVKRAVVLSGLPEVIFDIELVFQMRKFDLVTYVHLSAAVISKWIFCVLINL